jgi:hypothetical protein
MIDWQEIIVIMVVIAAGAQIAWWLYTNGRN